MAVSGSPLNFGSGSVPRPFVVPKNPTVPSMGPGPEFGRRIRATPIIANGTNNKPNGEWTIASGNIDVVPFPYMGYHTTIREGQLMFCMNQSYSADGRTKIGDVMLPIFCLNHATGVAKTEANREISDLMSEHRHTLPPGLPNANSLGDDNQRLLLLNLLKKPEKEWSYLFGQDSALTAVRDGLSKLQYLCKQGLLNKFNYVGSCLVAPAVQYGPTDPPRTTGRLQMTLGMEGVVYLDNLWPEAFYGSFLFLKLVRVRVRDNQGNYQYDKFAYITWSSQHLKEMPPREVEYLGTSGMMETGAAWLVGQCLDLPSTRPTKETVRIALGLQGTPEEANMAGQACGKIKVCLVSPSRVY
jgi:hypothetical protein